MSQSTTYYRLSQEIFDRIEKGGLDAVNIVSAAKGRATIQGTAAAFKFLFSKRLHTQPSLLQLFEPTKRLLVDPSGYGLSVSYTEPHEVEAAAEVFSSFTDEELVALYDPEELNQAKVYPGGWRWERGTNQGCTEKHLLLDFTFMKELFSEAAQDKDYVLAFSG